MGKDLSEMTVEGQALHVNKEIIFHWWFIGNRIVKNCTMSKCNVMRMMPDVNGISWPMSPLKLHR